MSTKYPTWAETADLLIGQRAALIEALKKLTAEAFEVAAPSDTPVYWVDWNTQRASLMERCEEASAVIARCEGTKP